MKKSVLLGIALVLLAFILPALAAERPAAPEGEIKMELTKKPVIFNHSTHADLDCAACHHPVEGVENYQKCATAGCHDVLDPKDKTVNSYYQAMHRAKDPTYATCVSCHITTAGDDKAMKKELAGCAKSKCHP